MEKKGRDNFCVPSEVVRQRSADSLRPTPRLGGFEATQARNELSAAEFPKSAAEF